MTKLSAIGYAPDICLITYIYSYVYIISFNPHNPFAGYTSESSEIVLGQISFTAVLS